MEMSPVKQNRVETAGSITVDGAQLWLRCANVVVINTNFHVCAAV